MRFCSAPSSIELSLCKYIIAEPTASITKFVNKESAGSKWLIIKGVDAASDIDKRKGAFDR